MKKLIEALTILLQYADQDDNYPTHCEHDEFRVYCGIKVENVKEEDILKLSELGFFWSEDDECFMSFRFGSC